MANNPASELASAIQSVSLKRHPSPTHDLNPSTAASKKEPATLHSPAASLAASDSSSIPSDVIDIRPRPRRKSFPPIPDFRFEQSYLASIRSASTAWQVAYITARDQILLPLTQGVLWNLAMHGWRFWNRGAKFGGRSVGARIRRWWWDVNQWQVPERGEVKMKKHQEITNQAGEVSFSIVSRVPPIVKEFGWLAGLLLTR